MDAAILQALEGIRCGFLNVLFAIFTFFGEETFIVLIIAIVFLCVKKSIGEQMLLTILSSSALCTILKSAIRRNRPFVKGTVEKVDIDTPLVSTNDLHLDQSFPSGHSASSSSFFGCIAANFRKKAWVVIVCTVIVLSVMLSRLYLGVHFPTDVLTGAAIGILSAIAWQIIYTKWYDKRLWIFLIIAALTVPFLFITRTMTSSMYKISGISLATAIALIIEDKYFNFQDADKLWKRIVRFAIALGAAGILFLLLGLLPDCNVVSFIKYFFAVLAALTVAPVCIVKFNL